MKDNWYFFGNKGLVNNPSEEDFKDEPGNIIKINIGVDEDIIIESW